MGVIGKRNTPKDWYTEYHIQQVLARDYMTHSKYTCYNLHIFDWESDFLFCTQAGYWHEVEIKISLADFKNDLTHKESKHYALQNGYCLYASDFDCGSDGHREITKYNTYEVKRPNYFSFCVPHYLLDKVRPLLPSYCGLYIVTNAKRLQQIVPPARLHKEKYTDDQLRLRDKFYWAYENWRDRNARWHDREVEYRQTINWLKAEYKAATGHDIEESL